MARSRNIKPGFFLNEKLAFMDPYAQLLFIGLWTLADKEGRLEYRPLKIKAQIFPYNSVQVEKFLDDLRHEKFIDFYTVDGEKYITINNWDKHQNPHKNEKPSELPKPSDNNKLRDNPEKIGTSPEKIGKARVITPDSLNLIPDSLNLIPDSLTSSDGQSPPRAVIHFPLNDKSQFPIHEDQVLKWEGLYPNVDIRQELRKMLGWLDANPTKRKTKTGILRFCNTWLSREQDKGGNNGPKPKSSGFAAGDEIGQKWVDSYTGDG